MYTLGRLFDLTTARVRTDASPAAASPASRARSSSWPSPSSAPRWPTSASTCSAPAACSSATSALEGGRWPEALLGELRHAHRRRHRRDPAQHHRRAGPRPAEGARPQPRGSPSATSPTQFDPGHHGRACSYRPGSLGSADSALVALPVGLAQDGLQELAAGVAGQLVAPLDRGRALVVGEALAGERDEVRSR